MQACSNTHSWQQSHGVCVCVWQPPGVKFNIVKNVSVLAGPPPLYPQGFEVYRPAALLPVCCRETQGDDLYSAASALTSGKVHYNQHCYRYWSKPNMRKGMTAQFNVFSRVEIVALSLCRFMLLCGGDGNPTWALCLWHNVGCGRAL